jgi:hypothetical protein
MQLNKKIIIEWLKENWFGLIFSIGLLIMIIVLIIGTRGIRTQHL